MGSVCFYFQVHQPWRLRYYTIFDIGSRRDYFEDESEGELNNRKVFEKVAHKCYLPANRLWLALLKKFPKLKLSFSLSGVVLDQMEAFEPEVLESFQSLVETGRVEILGETYFHSLSSLACEEEFRQQVLTHQEKIKRIFGLAPKVFRNTELIYQNSLGRVIEDLGFSAVLVEGADHILGWRSPNFLYRPAQTKNLVALLKNYKLSDDIAFRFSEKSWGDWPLTAPKFAVWVKEAAKNSQLVNIFLDYETFGEHQWQETGIFDFLEKLPEELFNHNLDFVTPSEAVKLFEPVGEIDAPAAYSWADIERDTSAWLGNEMQRKASRELYDLRNLIFSQNDEALLNVWRNLSTSDHFYYMCTKWFKDGDVHKYFNPYKSPYEAFIVYMNVLSDLKLRLDFPKEKGGGKNGKKGLYGRRKFEVLCS